MNETSDLNSDVQNENKTDLRNQTCQNDQDVSMGCSEVQNDKMNIKEKDLLQTCKAPGVKYECPSCNETINQKRVRHRRMQNRIYRAKVSKELMLGLTKKINLTFYVTNMALIISLHVKVKQFVIIKTGTEE